MNRFNPLLAMLYLTGHIIGTTYGMDNKINLGDALTSMSSPAVIQTLLDQGAQLDTWFKSVDGMRVTPMGYIKMQKEDLESLPTRDENLQLKLTWTNNILSIFEQHTTKISALQKSTVRFRSFLCVATLIATASTYVAYLWIAGKKPTPQQKNVIINNTCTALVVSATAQPNPQHIKPGELYEFTQEYGELEIQYTNEHNKSEYVLHIPLDDLGKKHDTHYLNITLSTSWLPWLLGNPITYSLNWIPKQGEKMQQTFCG